MHMGCILTHNHSIYWLLVCAWLCIRICISICMYMWMFHVYKNMLCVFTYVYVRLYLYLHVICNLLKYTRHVHVYIPCKILKMNAYTHSQYYNLVYAYVSCSVHFADIYVHAHVYVWRMKHACVYAHVNVPTRTKYLHLRSQPVELYLCMHAYMRMWMLQCVPSIYTYIDGL